MDLLESASRQVVLSFHHRRINVTAEQSTQLSCTFLAHYEQPSQRHYQMTFYITLSDFLSTRKNDLRLSGAIFSVILEYLAQDTTLKDLMDTR